MLDSYLDRDHRATSSRHVDPETGQPLVDLILDTAGQKGTGKWTVISALDLGVPLTLIAEAVFARCLSAQKDERVAAAEVLRGPRPTSPATASVHRRRARCALYASKIISYAQGFVLLRAAAEESRLDLNNGRRRPDVARRAASSAAPSSARSRRRSTATRT